MNNNQIPKVAVVTEGINKFDHFTCLIIIYSKHIYTKQANKGIGFAIVKSLAKTFEGIVYLTGKLSHIYIYSN